MRARRHRLRVLILLGLGACAGLLLYLVAHVEPQYHLVGTTTADLEEWDRSFQLFRGWQNDLPIIREEAKPVFQTIESFNRANGRLPNRTEFMAMVANGTIRQPSVARGYWEYDATGSNFLLIVPYDVRRHTLNASHYPMLYYSSDTGEWRADG